MIRETFQRTEILQYGTKNILDFWPQNSQIIVKAHVAKNTGTFPDHDDDEIAEIVANPWSAGNLAPRRDQCHISQNSLSYLVALSAPQNTPGGEITFNKLLHQAYIVLLLRNWIEIKPSLLNQITKLHRGQPVALVWPWPEWNWWPGYLGVASSKNGFSVRTELYFRGFVLWQSCIGRKMEPPLPACWIMTEGGEIDLNSRPI